jgi:cellobiose-specific phosphotransferase system component IIC
MIKPHLSIPVLAALLFGLFSVLAALSIRPLLARFASEAQVSEWIFIAVPALFAMLFALIVYGGAARHVKTINQSLSRGLLVAILAWFSFSALATWAWCLPAHYLECYSRALLVSGALGGGQMLLAALIAATIVGYAIRVRTSGSWKLKD